MMCKNPCRVAMWLLGGLLVAFVGSAGPQTKVRIDLTERDDVTTEEIIEEVMKAKKASRQEETSVGKGYKGVQRARVASSPTSCDSAHSGRELGRGVEPTLAIKVHFAFNSAEILATEQGQLTRVGPALSSGKLASDCIRIEGHTDSIGSDEFNLRLSEKRAKSVKQYLVEKYGIAPERLIPVGRGERERIADNATPEGRQKNRRAEFVFLESR